MFTSASGLDGAADCGDVNVDGSLGDTASFYEVSLEWLVRSRIFRDGDQLDAKRASHLDAGSRRAIACRR